MATGGSGGSASLGELDGIIVSLQPGRAPPPAISNQMVNDATKIGSVETG